MIVRDLDGGGYIIRFTLDEQRILDRRDPYGKLPRSQILKGELESVLDRSNFSPLNRSY
jgi:hypothetical protein